MTKCTEKLQNGITTEYDYQYDKDGNRSKYVKTVDGEWVECYTYEYNASNQLLSRTNQRLWTDNVTYYTYDADGNLISEQTGHFEKTYEYTAENRLAVVKEQGTVLMAALYDGDGNRLFTMDYTGENNDRWDIWIPECGGNADQVDDSAKDAMRELASLVSRKDRRDYTITEYVNDVTRENEEVLAELNPRGRVTTAYTYGYNRESADVYGDTQYYLYDGQGNVSRISSEWGRVKETYSYDPYGNLTYGIPDTVNYYGYNGESSNLATGLQYLRARYYNPQNGNFITEDTYAGQISNPLTLNRYDYVSNNPVNYTDPSGHVALPKWMQDGLNSAGEFLTSLGDMWNTHQQNQQYEHQLVAEFVTGNLTKPGETDKIASETVEELTGDNETDTEPTKGEDNSNPLVDKVNQIIAVNEKQKQAELEIQQAYCDGLQSPSKEVKVAIGAGVIVATGTVTVLTGGATSNQLLGSVIGGLAGAIIHHVFAEGDKAEAAADGFMWGSITGALSPTIGHLVGQLSKTFTTLANPTVAAAFEGLLETVMEEFAILMQGGEVNPLIFMGDWAVNSFTSGSNPLMQKLFDSATAKGRAILEKILKFGDDTIPDSVEKEVVEEIIEGGSKTIPYTDYDNIYQSSIHNADADMVMLGKYDGGGPSSYINQAGDDYTYFSLDNWNEIKTQYGLTDDDMFKLFNEPFLDDGINAGKVFEFSHNPVGDQDSLGKEFRYLLENGYIWDESTMTMRPGY